MIGDSAQYQELVKLYNSYGDDELVALGRGISDLTDTAQQALKNELTQRGLKISPAKTVEVRIPTDEDLADMRTYAESAPTECIFDFDQEAAASAAYYALIKEGIEAIVISPSNNKPDAHGPRVVVTPKDAERATAILSQPSTEELKAETEETPEEFALPHCPSCGGEETLLESVDPVNEWRCDSCGNTWLEETVSSVP